MRWHTLLATLSLTTLASSVAAGDDPCETAAHLQADSAAFELKEELLTRLAGCVNLTDPADKAECIREARIEYIEGMELAGEIFEARLDLCDLLGGGAYDPEIDPDDFSPVIDNPYLPFPVGAHWIYEAETDEGLEVIDITVLTETREILGVECVSVRDTVTLDGEFVEDTIDWYAQDTDGNVWYFGEISFNYEDGYVADIDGSWLSGVDGAKPGIVMLAEPSVGTTYRQEYFIGEAEDAATVLDDDATITLGVGTFEHCVQTADFLPPEPDALEHKYYAMGIGFIYETKPDEDEELELVAWSGL